MIGRYGPPIFQILQGIKGAYNVALMKAIPHGIEKEFMRAYLKRDELLKYLEHFQQRTAGQAGIEMDKLRSYPCPLPPVEEQLRYVEFVRQADKSKFVLQSAIATAQATKRSLIAEALGLGRKE
jgi:type I restriction enzyme S subunit